ncbi:cation diffusion facilitator family transporter [Sulfuriflexus sp.]|uniref:cation diffusion facilitator family transporter n=1 Tax=Sulfuriflexus sp. TaxID=2015443 RepID=UPI0028CF85FF|nr:cation diffusion facilitator family transporter [Sulfuriflexus sp.]MDT8404077.1 cation diffusion facilitator family transporter [Sulfuriflexus sp.]
MAHTHSKGMSPQDLRYKEVRKVTLIGSAVDLLLGIAKMVVGGIAHSQALIADGVHSLSDLATDFMVLFAAKHASRDADEDHPYGHGRIETAMTVALGAALILVSVGIAWDAVERLFAPETLLHPGWLALVVAAISVVAKEVIYHYTMHVAHKLRSRMLRANAWHSRSDAISSVIVFVGVLGAMSGLDYLDAIAAIGVALMIARIGQELAWHSIRELIDTGLDEERIVKIRETIKNVDGVVALHMLRSRRMGPDAFVDVHIQVQPKLSVSEGHQISEMVRRQLIDDIEEVSDVMVHIDPEDDEFAMDCCDLPDRRQIIARLQQYWAGIPEAKEINSYNLHYLNGKIHVEAKLPLAVVSDSRQATELGERLQRATRDDDEIAEVAICFTG